jgi:hypothetical protein
MQELIDKYKKNVSIPTENYEANYSGHGLRGGWEQSKKQGKLTGCGLLGNLTMDEIESLQYQIEEATSVWSNLAGLPGKAVTQQEKQQEELSATISDLQKEIRSLKELIVVNEAKNDVATIKERVSVQEMYEPINANRKVIQMPKDEQPYISKDGLSSEFVAQMDAKYGTDNWVILPEFSKA